MVQINNPEKTTTDFLAMQRKSFCWFLIEGLNEELRLVSRIYDFDDTMEYLLFGEEYRLIKPKYSLIIAKKYSGNYKARIVFPMEVRNKTDKNIEYKLRFPLITLPLMTTYGTFILNGCERVIVSQIIRSPGIYFEKNKKIKKIFHRKLSIDVRKLREFLPSGEAFVSEFELFFPKTQTVFELKKELVNKDLKLFKLIGLTPIMLPEWKQNSIYYYSSKYLKQIPSFTFLHFLNCLKAYKVILSSINKISKIKLIQLFLKWIHLINNKVTLRKNKIVYMLILFKFLTKLLIRFQVFQIFNDKNKLKSSHLALKVANLNKQVSLLNITDDKTNDFIYIYKNFIKNCLIFSEIHFNSELILIIDLYKNLLTELNQFSFLKKTINKLLLNKQEIFNLFNSGYLLRTLYFSTSLKDKSKYLFGPKTRHRLTFLTELEKIELKLKPVLDKPYLDPCYIEPILEDPLYDLMILNKFEKKFDKAILSKNKDFGRRHNYMKSKSHLLISKNDHEIQTNYHKKYGKKELYKAILIPEIGSWIRFTFQKNKKLNLYKYPIKNNEDDIIIQLDKINQKSILSLLKEMGLTDIEMYSNLQHADFFYFDKPFLTQSEEYNQPVLRFNETLKPKKSKKPKKISEFSRIFDPKHYYLGNVGRLKINNRLNLKLSENLQIITYEDIFGIIDKLISLTISKGIADDIDHLKNRRVRSIGELLQDLVKVGFQKLVKQTKQKINDSDSIEFLSMDLVNSTIREFFCSSQLSQYLDQTNPLSSLTHRRRISGLGPGGFNRDRISFSVRDIHPSHYGRICPIETPEGQNVGLIASLTTYARLNLLGFLETPFWRVINGKVIKNGNPIYLTADLEDSYKITTADTLINDKNYLLKNSISVKYKQDFKSVFPSDIDFIMISPIQIVSIAASLIPFFEHDDANRALMGSNMQRQSVPLLFPQKPIVGTGIENQIALDSGMILSTKISGIVTKVTSNKIVIKNKSGKKAIYKLQKYMRSNQQTCINHRPSVWQGEKVISGQMITDGPSITNNELSLGQNVLVAYMPWQGYNFEDAILINERLVYDDIFTSIHIERYKVEIDQDIEMHEEMTKNIPNLDPIEIQNLNDQGIVRVGTFVKPGDILVGKIISNEFYEQLPESKLLRAIFGTKAQGVKDNSYRLPSRQCGRILETVTFNRKQKSIYKSEKIYIFMAQIRKIKVGDKIAGRHGNKGIISCILPRQDMPFLPDGTPIDIILNPLGVPSRMNVGQLYECLLGLAGDRLNLRFKILPFDEMYGLEMSRILINKKLRQASIVKNESWLFNPYTPGKIILVDGRTGKEFDNPITVGNAYMLKLIHLVDDKMHARSTGPYSLITQQPLRGKARHGGQRFGEMEVWALEGFGAAFTLKELLTLKSDDIDGRNETLHAIINGYQIPKFGVPESFKVLLQELRSMGLDMSTYRLEKFSSSENYEKEVNLVENYQHLSTNFNSTLETLDTNNILF